MVGLSAVLVVMAVSVGTLLVTGLAVYSHYNASVPAATEFRNLQVSVALWGLSELTVFLFPSNGTAVKAAYTARLLLATLTALLAIVFVAEYTQSKLLNRPTVRWLLWGGFGAAVVLWLANPGGVAYRELTVHSFQGITVVNPTFGPGFLLYSLFVYGFYVVMFAILVLFILDSTNVYRKQTALISAAFFIVVAGTVALFLGVSPQEGLDLGPVFNALSGVLIWGAIYRYEFLTVVPLAKESIIDTITDPVLVFDEADQLIYANAATGAVGVTDDHRNEHAEEIVPELETALADGGVIYREADQAAVENERVFEPVAEPIIDHHGLERGRVVIMREVTKRHRREQRLDEFASIVSHDLRNPLNVAKLYVELANDTGEIEPLDDAENALDRMEQLVDDLLTVSRAGYNNAETEEIPLSNIAHAAWDSVETDESTLEIDADDSIVANDSRLQELFENLFRNAVEHNEGSVTVRVEMEDGGFAVADDGRGIPEPKRDEVFDAGMTTAEDGTGFGLYIVRQIAEVHGWTAAVEESTDGGARFAFSTESDAMAE
jgi:signal transduction histidine kinase